MAEYLLNRVGAHGNSHKKICHQRWTLQQHLTEFPDKNSRLIAALF